MASYRKTYVLTHRHREREVLGTSVIVAGALAGAWTGGRVAGVVGLAAGALVGGIVGALAVGRVRALTVAVEPHGRVSVRCDLCD